MDMAITLHSGRLFAAGVLYCGDGTLTMFFLLIIMGSTDKRGSRQGFAAITVGWG